MYRIKKENIPGFQSPIRLAFLLFIIALCLRIIGLGQESLWADEFYTLQTAQHKSCAEVLAHVQSVDPHPPLYFLLIHVMISLFGSSDIALRLPSVLFGSLAVSCFYFVARLIFPRQPLLAFLSAVLLLISPMHIWYSQEARPYAFLHFLEVIAIWACLVLGRGIREGSPDAKNISASFALVLFSTAALFTHYFSLFLVVSLLTMLLIYIWRKRRADSLLISTIVLMFIPFIVCLIQAKINYTSGGGIDWLPDDFQLIHLIDVVRAPIAGPLYSPFPLYILFFILAAGISLMILGFIGLLKSRVLLDSKFFIINGLLFCAIVPVLVSLIFRPIIFYGQRYLIISLPFVHLLLVACFLSPKRRIKTVSAFLIGVILIGQIGYLAQNYGKRQKRLWDYAANFILDQSQDGDFIYMPSRNLYPLLSRYLKERRALTTIEDFPQKQISKRTFVVSLYDQTENLEKQGFSPGCYSVLILETNRPGQNIWIYVLCPERIK